MQRIVRIDGSETRCRKLQGSSYYERLIMLDLGDVMSDRAAQREHGAYLAIVYDRDVESPYRARDILTTKRRY